MIDQVMEVVVRAVLLHYNTHSSPGRNVGVMATADPSPARLIQWVMKEVVQAVLQHCVVHISSVATAGSAADAELRLTDNTQ